MRLVYSSVVECLNEALQVDIFRVLFIEIFNAMQI